MNSMADSFRFFEKIRIYLPDSLCTQLHEFIQGIRRKVIEFGVYVRNDDTDLISRTVNKKHEAWTNSWDYLEKEVPLARASLEAELRRLLGGE
jgi:hypothetical protein